MTARRQRRNAKLCRQKRHPLTKGNLIISKDGQRRCLACWWERKLNFVEAFNRSKAKGVTTASVDQLLEWSKKARRDAKIAESTKDAAALLKQQQDLRLFWAKRKFQEAQKRFEKIVQILHEISEASKLKANSTHPEKGAGKLSNVANRSLLTVSLFVLSTYAGSCNQSPLPESLPIRSIHVAAPYTKDIYSVEELLVNPQSFAHTVVTVSGCYISGFEMSALMACDERSGLIWVEDARAIVEDAGLLRQ